MWPMMCVCVYVCVCVCACVWLEGGTCAKKETSVHHQRIQTVKQISTTKKIEEYSGRKEENDANQFA
uniref:Secreted peptide n=1 Tax=Anopheles braziliensis TaxID=58242 RepID=A0A2M3ZLM9_9DIPT